MPHAYLEECFECGKPLNGPYCPACNEHLVARVLKRNERGEPIVILVDDRAFIAATHLQKSKVK